MARQETSEGVMRVRTDPSVPPLAQLLANSWRSRILRELTLRPMSIKQFVEEVGGPTSTISRHFAQLYEWGFIELVETKSGGDRFGAVERLYRALQTDDLDSEAWAALTQEEREAKSDNAIASYLQRVIEAVESKTFDAHLGRHWSWDAVELDERAFSELGAELDEVLARLKVRARETEERVASSGGETIWTTLGLASFASPRETERKAPRATSEGDDPALWRDGERPGS